MSSPGSFGTFPLSVRLLLINHLLGNIGFYMLIPFLADYLLSDLALSAAVIGVVLGVRNLSQQGLFLVGGTASDRLGARGVIIAGAAIRAAGFAMFAVGGSLPVVLLGSVLTGFAGALFNPAVRAYIARAGGDRSAHAFALFNVMGNTGSAIGPLIGTLLLGAGFRLTAVAAAAVFAALTVAQLILLPASTVAARHTTLGADLVRVFTDLRFWGFAVALMGMFALQSQIYFLFTLQVQQLAGPAAVAALFLVETVAVVACQVPITRALSIRPDRGPAMAAGMALLGAAFLLPPSAALYPAPSGAGPLALTIRLLPVLAGAVVLAIGVAMVQPFVNEAIPRFAGDALTGSYFGAFYLASGVFTVSTTAGLGALVDRSGSPFAWPPALCCTAVGVLSALGILVLRGRGILPAAGTPLPRQTPTTKGGTHR
ncbi:MFS transporter [Nocardia jinanensis]|uniref:ABC transport system membrane protein n=1 Tax=Nocardia jinanensis TaxID=382504 RepID=A0A917R5K5_9NOCA|nr:MFS transporter [Nocardia jinanensis]GGK90473.1 putative ABC transport system membrane protein [Nocardia jinanensis]